ncbi:hypothetical protein KC221_29375, partial [Mycobacterium tuberculosis]|nr:hypothetical protein [Mycobacterium tuberculosis]
MEPGAMSDPQWQLETLAVHGGYRPDPTTRAADRARGPDPLPGPAPTPAHRPAEQARSGKET